MAAALIIFRLGLAGVFGIAAGAKLADLAGSRKAAADFGVPAALAPVVGVALPLAELVVAALLLPSSTACAGALAAVALLLAFSLAIGVNLARGRAPQCHCFGQLHSEPAGVRTLARNAVLAGVAVFVAIAGWTDAGPNAVAWIGRLDPSGVVALVAVAIALITITASTLVVTHVMQSRGRLLLRLDRYEAALREAGINPTAIDLVLPPLGLPVGSIAPGFELEAIDGGRRRLDELSADGRPLLLMFLDADCGPCRELLPQAARWQRDRDLNVVVASAGDRETIARETARHGLDTVLLDADRRAYALYQGAGTPSAVFIAPDLTIASPLAAGGDHVERLVALYSTTRAAGLPLGTDAPDVQLESLAGESTSLAELRGQPTVLVFWNPSCGYCRGIHTALLDEERRRTASDPRLVIVSGGSREAVRDEGFRSLVLLDDAFAAGGKFGATGTPTAIAIDAAGRVASRVGVGSSAVLALVARG